MPVLAPSAKSDLMNSVISAAKDDNASRAVGGSRPSLSNNKSAAANWQSAFAKVKLANEQRRQTYQYTDEASGKVPFRIKLSFGAPSFVTLSLLNMICNVYLITFYERLGTSLSEIAFFTVLARCIDVLSDPCMAQISDSTRSRWGRRRPFMFSGCWFYSLFFFLLMMPPQDQASMSTWFGIFYILFFLCNTWCNIPYDALGPELTDNYEERSSVFFFCTMFDGLGVLVAATMPTVFKGMAMSSLGGCEDHGCGSAPDVNASDTDLQEFDDCVVQYGGECNNDAWRQAMVMTAIFFGSWYVLSMNNVVYQIKERKESVTGPADPFVPSILDKKDNKPFMQLLPAWICDAIMQGVVMSMMPHWVLYVIDPAGSCKKAEYSETNWDYAVVCNDDMSIVAALVLFMMCALIFTPVWLLFTQKIGKRNTWLMFNLVNAVTNAFFVIPSLAVTSPSNTWLAIIIAGINGMPVGAKFLSDAILADIIDYDELLTGSRSEASYMVFKGFLPKMVSIPASTLPVALMGTFGFQPSQGGLKQEQPVSLLTFLIVMFVFIPVVFALLSFKLKRTFPLKEKEQCVQIASGVAMHSTGESAVCPLTKVKVPPAIPFTEEEAQHRNRLNHFRGMAVVESLLSDQKAGFEKITASAKKQLMVCVTLFIVAIVAAVLAFPLLETYNTANDNSWIPSLAVFLCGVVLDACLFCVIRYNTATAMQQQPMPVSVLNKMLLERRDRFRITDAKRIKLNPKLDPPYPESSKPAAPWGKKSSLGPSTSPPPDAGPSTKPKAAIQDLGQKDQQPAPVRTQATLKTSTASGASKWGASGVDHTPRGIHPS